MHVKARLSCSYRWAAAKKTQLARKADPDAATIWNFFLGPEFVCSTIRDRLASFEWVVGKSRCWAAESVFLLLVFGWVGGMLWHSRVRRVVGERYGRGPCQI